MEKYFSLAPLLFFMNLGMAFADIYGGLGFDYGSPHAGIDRYHSSIIIGNRYNGTNYFYGGEIDFGTSLDDSVEYSTSRARLLVGVPLKNVSPIFGLGGTLYIDNGTNYASPNISGGIEMLWGNSASMRFEAIRDFNPNHTTPVTVVRLAIIRSY